MHRTKNLPCIFFSFFNVTLGCTSAATSDSSQDSLIKWYLLQFVYKNLKALQSSLNQYNFLFQQVKG